MELPFTDVSKEATAPTCTATRQQFIDTVAKLINPFVDPSHSKVAELQIRPIDGWVFIEIGAPESSSQEGAQASDLVHLVSFTQSYWSSRIEIRLKDRTVLGQLDQMRYWTLTEARSLTLDWLQPGEALEPCGSPLMNGQVGVSAT
jgi:hypothetical protein